MEGEARGVALTGEVAAESVVIGGAGPAEVLGHEAAVRVQHLPITNANPGARGPFDFEANDPGKILAEVEDVNSIGRRGDSDRLNFLDAPDWQSGKCFEPGRAGKAQIKRPPLNFHSPSRGRLLAFIQSCLDAAPVPWPNRCLPLAVADSRTG